MDNLRYTFDFVAIRHGQQLHAGRLHPSAAPGRACSAHFPVAYREASCDLGRGGGGVLRRTLGRNRL